MCVWQPTAIVMSSSLKGLPINKTSQAVFTVCSLFCLRKKNASSYAKMYLLRALGSFTSMPRCICWGHLVLSQVCQDVSAEGIWFFHKYAKMYLLRAFGSFTPGGQSWLSSLPIRQIASCVRPQEQNPVQHFWLLLCSRSSVNHTVTRQFEHQTTYMYKIPSLHLTSSFLLPRLSFSPNVFQAWGEFKSHHCFNHRRMLKPLRQVHVTFVWKGPHCRSTTAAVAQSWFPVRNKGAYQHQSRAS